MSAQNRPPVTSQQRAPRPDGRNVVFTVCKMGDNRPDYWHPIGRAYFNRDGSISVKLLSLPLDGRLVIMHKPDGEQGGGE